VTLGRARRAMAVLVLSGVRTAGAEPCAPRASISGDAEAVTSVGAELVRLGVATGAAKPGCRGVTAVVQQERDGGISVAVSDSAHRSEGRVVSDPALAAAWIDSWLHDDFEVAPAPMPVAEEISPPRDAVVASIPARDPFDRFALSAGYELAWTSTSSSWSGFGAAACVKLGELCLGARGRYLSETEKANLSALSRSDVSLLATASWSKQIGTMSIAPELGLGVGRMTTSRLDSCVAPPACDPTDPTCKPLPPPPCKPESGTLNQVYVGDNFTSATVTPRAEAALRIAVPLFQHVWLDGTAAITLAPFGHADAYTPTMSPPGTTPSDVALPGEPLASFQLGVGLRVGAP